VNPSLLGAHDGLRRHGQAMGLGVIMTGTGNDGAQGQWETIAKGAVDLVLPLNQIARRALELAVSGERVHA